MLAARIAAQYRDVIAGTFLTCIDLPHTPGFHSSASGGKKVAFLRPFNREGLEPPCLIRERLDLRRVGQRTATRLCCPGYTLRIKSMVREPIFTSTPLAELRPTQITVGMR